MPENQYLLRFDDICPTMNWANWELIEQELVKHNVRPILAVVPDNRDPSLMTDPPAPDFWDRVRKWQSMGFTIAIHGFQHVYVNHNKGLMRLTPNSEFTGLPYEVQKEKLVRGLAIFSEQGVVADAFVAPSHSFDATTLKILVELGLKVVCDGLWPWPHTDADSIFWVPQQLWRFSAKSSGVWTVCNHHNRWSPEYMAVFKRDLATYAPRMTDVATLTKLYRDRPLTFGDRFIAMQDLIWNHRVLPAMGRLRRLIFKSRRST
ncbi:DUF2334 domain-containing protein [Geothrix sp. 21YS21S-2]|uniref:DUF2334 domain-containing protein n=1 Tax=Geothrix sp. 21YS21S-2 TaxID=3068893 RepID=UPI0027BAEED1|nr:DUF2334 domain-containing protein [Geothrix sp. 21YS21S-2]